MPSTTRKITAGELTVPVNIQERTLVLDDSGGRTYDWTTVWPRVYCKLVSRPIVSLDVAQGVIAGASHTATMRYRPGIQQGMRLLNLTNNQPLYVQTIIDVDAAHIWLDVYCVEHEPLRA